MRDPLLRTRGYQAFVGVWPCHPMISETLGEKARNELAQSELVPIGSVRTVAVPIVLVPTVTVRTVLVLSVAAQTWSVQNDWALNALAQNVRFSPAARSYQVVKVAKEVHCAVHSWSAHYEVLHSAVVHCVVVPHCVVVVRSVEAELRCAGVVLHCVAEVQRVSTVRYAWVSQTSAPTVHSFSQVAQVQPARDLAWACPQFLY